MVNLYKMCVLINYYAIITSLRPSISLKKKVNQKMGVSYDCMGYLVQRLQSGQHMAEWRMRWMSPILQSQKASISTAIPQNCPVEICLST